MKKNIKNPFAIAFGRALRELRQEKYSSDDIAQHIGLHSSKYRLVEAGSAVLSEIYIPKLMELDCFEEINLNHILQLSMLVNIWEKIDKISPINTLADINGLHSSIQLIFNKNNKSIAELVEEDIDPKGTIKFLEYKINSISQDEKIDLFKNKLSDEYEKVPCVFIPLVKGYYNNIKKSIEYLEEYDNVEKSVNSFKEKVAELNSLELTFNSENSPDFVNNLPYTNAYGIINNIENLNTSLTLDKYGKYISRIWKVNTNVKLHLLVKSDLETSEISKIVHNFKTKTLFNNVYKKYINKNAESIDEVFSRGLSNLIFKRAKENNQYLLNFLDNSLEYWYYEVNQDTKYAFYTVKLNDGEREYFNYSILNIGEINKKQRLFKELYDNHFEFII